ncbi:hypothetical protein WR25_11259 [Diploscapter pachys]|uniref:Ig-like domain-containing protein n=1 Tax=Diploscapter pachys TaxID=2018661 RepID=A0A2A2L8M4_9BILA|nr:hypothetical protein WR25_11259 [Diploscapter pachys]
MSKFQVAWTRASDQAILTAGMQSFSADPRWQVSKKGDDWILILRRAEVSDTGCYFCDINTDTENTLYAVYLQVQEPPTSPNHGQKKQPKLMANMAGDEVLLNCTIYDDPEEIKIDDNSIETNPRHRKKTDREVIWTRDGQLIDLNNTAKYVWKVKRWTGVAEHIGRIRSATMDDDGDYACERGHIRASQIVHINRSEAQKRNVAWNNASKSYVMSTFLYILLSLVSLR